MPVIDYLYNNETNGNVMDDDRYPYVKNNKKITVQENIRKS